MQDQSTLTLFVQAKALPSKESDLHLALLELAEQSRQDEGCLQYDVYIDKYSQRKFTLFENWISDDLWQKHMESKHVKKFTALSKGLIADWQMQNLRPALSFMSPK